MLNCCIFFTSKNAKYTTFSMKTSVYFLLFLYSVGKHWLDFWLIFKLISVYGANELTGDTGDIVSPLYPSSYIPSIDLYVDSSWRITVDSGFKIRIRQIFRFHEKKINCKIFLFWFHEFFFLFQIFCIWNWSQWILWWRMLIYNCHLWWFWWISWGITSSMWYRYMP